MLFVERTCWSLGLALLVVLSCFLACRVAALVCGLWLVSCCRSLCSVLLVTALHFGVCAVCTSWPCPQCPSCVVAES